MFQSIFNKQHFQVDNFYKRKNQRHLAKRACEEIEVRDMPFPETRDNYF